MRTRVLIAEDEPLMALLLRQGLGAQGYEVVGTAGTGVEALALCESLCPDVILMDVQMPEMDGLEATRAVMSARPTCVLLVTGITGLDGQAEQAGAMGYAIKPLQPDRIRLLIDGGRQRFARFQAITAEAGEAADALGAWHLVQRAVRLLMAREQLSEEAAFVQLRQSASETGSSLAEAAGRTAAGDEDVG